MLYSAALQNSKEEGQHEGSSKTGKAGRADVNLSTQSHTSEAPDLDGGGHAIHWVHIERDGATSDTGSSGVVNPFGKALTSLAE